MKSVGSVQTTSLAQIPHQDKEGECRPVCGLQEAMPDLDPQNLPPRSRCKVTGTAEIRTSIKHLMCLSQV